MEQFRESWSRAGWVPRALAILLLLGMLSFPFIFGASVARLVSDAVSRVVLGADFILIGLFTWSWPSEAEPGQERTAEALRIWQAAGYILVGIATIMVGAPIAGFWYLPWLVTAGAIGAAGLTSMLVTLFHLLRKMRS